MSALGRESRAGRPELSSNMQQDQGEGFLREGGDWDLGVRGKGTMVGSEGL